MNKTIGYEANTALFNNRLLYLKCKKNVRSKVLFYLFKMHIGKHSYKVTY